MSNSSCGCCGHGHEETRHRRGPSSYWMQNPDLIFSALNLKEGDRFLDMGCGPGDYAIRASMLVGDSGVVYAVDKWKYAIDNLVKEAASQGFKNIEAMAADITGPLSIEDHSVDVCLIATVLHAFSLIGDGNALFNEIHRVLKPSGRLAVIECKKEDQPFGPPKPIRLSPKQVEDAVGPYGFERIESTDLGYNYMIQFGVK